MTPALLVVLLLGCEKKFDITTLPSADLTYSSSDTSYVKKAVWSGIFNRPRTVMVGDDQLVYVADTYNNRIIMLNQAGLVLSFSNFVLHPIALAQDSRKDLLVGAETIEPTTGDTIGVILRFGLVQAAFHLNAAPIDTIWKEPARPRRRFVGIGIILNNEYLVARDGPDNSSVVDPDARVMRFRYRPDAATRKDSFLTSLGELQSGAGNAVTFINHPTGLATFSGSGDFVLTQSASGVSYSAIWMFYTKNTDFDGWAPKFDPTNPSQSNIDFISPSRFRNAVGVGIDRIKRDIFIIDDVDGLRDSVVKFNSRGFFKQESFGTLSAGATLKNPGGAAVYGAAADIYTLFICDTDNNRIVLYRLSSSF